MRAIDGDALQEKLTKKKPGPANARYTEGFNDALLRFKSMIHTAPTIESEQKKGIWVKIGQSFVSPEKFRNYSCSECGYDIDKIKFNFCPNCGADMRGDSNE